MIWLIIGKGNETSKAWHGGFVDARQLRWLLAIAVGAGLVAVAVALSFGSGGGPKKLATNVRAIPRHTLANDIQAFLGAWSVQHVQCTSPGARGERSCRVEFSNAYGTWLATLVVGRHHAVKDPGGNANWLCAAACTPLPTTTGLPRSPLGAGNGTTVDNQNSGVVYGNSGAYGTGNTGVYGTGNSGAYYGTGNTAGTYSGTSGAGYTGTSGSG